MVVEQVQGRVLVVPAVPAVGRIIHQAAELVIRRQHLQAKEVMAVQE